MSDFDSYSSMEKTEDFIFNETKYTINIILMGNYYSAKVYLAGKPVSPQPPMKQSITSATDIDTDPATDENSTQILLDEAKAHVRLNHGKWVQ